MGKLAIADIRKIYAIAYTQMLAASVKDDPTTTNRQLKTEKSKPF